MDTAKDRGGSEAMPEPEVQEREVEPGRQLLAAWVAKSEREFFCYCCGITTRKAAWLEPPAVYQAHESERAVKGDEGEVDAASI